MGKNFKIIATAHLLLSTIESYAHRLTKSYKNYGTLVTCKKILHKTLSKIKQYLDMRQPKSCALSKPWVKISSSEENLKVSVVVPSYNHGEYLPQRLNSIYSQSYSNYEVILLDDCSTDNSRAILLQYSEQYPEKTKVIFNDTNTGNPFSQWLRGIKAASGDLIWIAESDDYCDSDFLEKLLPSFTDEAVMLAYCSTDFVQNGKKIWDISAYLSKFDINFKKSFFITAHQLVQKVMFCKNPIVNSSSALFRKPVSIPEELVKTISSLKLCGDWLFYLYIIKGGVISFVSTTKNYYRIHQKSTSLRVQKTFDYYREQYRILLYIAQNYKISPEHIDKKYIDIKKEYASSNKDDGDGRLEVLFNRPQLYLAIKNRVPNIGICCFAFTVGGGEFFPIYLANALRNLGYAVTFLDFGWETRNENVRRKLAADIPVIYSPQNHKFNTIVVQLGLEVLHSHHGGVDNVICQLNSTKNFQHIVTLHGFYEAIGDDVRARERLQYLQKKHTHFTYTADKNLILAQQAGIDVKMLRKVPNGLPTAPTKSISRESLGLSKNDFVLCLVSRALPSKGWGEAIEIVKMVNKKSPSPVHLLLIGEGEMYERLRKKPSNWIHFLGNQFCLQDFYALSDMGFFPSRYPGESFPLVNIECLITGTPVIASDVGEIAHQLTTQQGSIAGALFALENGNIPLQKVTEIILNFVNDKTRLEQAKKAAQEQALRFDIKSVAQKYIQIYLSTMSSGRRY